MDSLYFGVCTNRHASNINTSSGLLKVKSSLGHGNSYERVFVALITICLDHSIEVLAVFKWGRKPPPKPAKKGSGMRSKSAKSLKFTRAGKKLAAAAALARKQENTKR